MASIKIKGLKQLEKALRKNATLSEVKKVVRENGAELHQQAQTNADFEKGYQTGALKKGIELDMENGGFEAKVEATQAHSPYPEWGTRYMNAQPYMKPAYNAQKIKFKRDMDKLVR